MTFCVLLLDWSELYEPKTYIYGFVSLVGVELTEKQYTEQDEEPERGGM